MNAQQKREWRLRTGRTKSGSKANFGEANGSAKLTAKDVSRIRRDRDQGVPVSALARRHGVHVTTIYYALAGKTWMEAAGR